MVKGIKTARGGVEKGGKEPTGFSSQKAVGKDLFSRVKGRSHIGLRINDRYGRRDNSGGNVNKSKFKGRRSTAGLSPKMWH